MTLAAADGASATTLRPRPRGITNGGPPVAGGQCPAVTRGGSPASRRSTQLCGHQSTDGEVDYRSDPHKFVYRQRGTTEDIRLIRASSMVTELTPVVLLLRGGLEPGDTLIIDEIEAHLHPAAQTQMATLLARLVRAGVRVLITTPQRLAAQGARQSPAATGSGLGGWN